jgi:hypothetical protein
VVAGLMRFRLGVRTILAHPGESVLIPAGKAHWFGNAGAEIAHARVEVRPALRMEELFAANEAVGVAGRCVAPGSRGSPTWRGSCSVFSGKSPCLTCPRGW